MKHARTTPLVHLELHTGDLAGARSFYDQLCGWRPELVVAGDRAYLAVDTGATVGGGIVQCPIQRPLWLPYVEVSEIRQATERAQVLGASVLLEPREGPAGWRSVVCAPDSGQIALWQPKEWR